MLLKLLTAAALGLVAPVAQAQPAPPAQTVPAAEPPVKSVPQSGRQAKPLPVDNDGLVAGPPETSRAGRAGRAPGRQHVDRAARRTHGPGGHGPGGHGPGGHGPRR